MIVLKKTKLFDTKPCTLKVSISQGILEKDEDKIIDSNQIFNDKLAKKEGLKYISVDDSSGIDKEELCSLSVEIKFNDIQYFRSNEEQKFSMKYDLEGIKTIPMLLTPQEKQCREIYKQGLINQACLVCNYNYERLKEEIFNAEDNPKMFWYQLTFSLLTYLSLKVLLDEAKKADTRLFIPLLRLHLILLPY